MHKKMLKVHFFLRNAVSASNSTKCSIYCQIEIVGQKRDTPYSTGIRIEKKYWMQGRVKNTHHLSQYYNDMLEEIERGWCSIYPSLAHKHGTVTYGLLKKQHHNTKNFINETKTLIACMNELILAHTPKITANTLKTYHTRQRNITEYLKKSGLTNILISEVKYSFVKNLMSYLEKKNTMAIDHINKHAVFIKQILDYAVNLEYLTTNPITRLHLRYSPIKPPKYLNQDLRKQLSSVNLPSLEKTKDIAIFLMHTGFSYTDYLSLNSSHLIASPEGLCFKKARDKSNVFSLPPLLKEAEQIIIKYKSIENLPKFNLADINKKLKILGDIAGINTETVGFNLSTSVFRETFSSMMENEYLLPTRTIMFMMGHTNARQLNNYSSVMPQKILREIKSNALQYPKDAA
jgi:integrase